VSERFFGYVSQTVKTDLQGRGLFAAAYPANTAPKLSALSEQTLRRYSLSVLFTTKPECDTPAKAKKASSSSYTHTHAACNFHFWETFLRDSLHGSSYLASFERPERATPYPPLVHAAPLAHGF